MSSAPVLKIRNLSTYFYTRRGVIKAVDRVSFEVEPGKLLGLVGESGCGKSVTALSILRLIEPPGRILSGEVWLNGCDLLKIPPGQLRQVRGREIALVFQDPLTSLNPVLTIGTQLAETIVSHEEVSRAEARRRAVELLLRMGLPDPERLMRLYPFQLSGGMRQRVMMAMAISMRPKVLIADEPTTALDVTVQAQILAELKRLQEEMGMAIILITHDLGVVAAMADEVAVMYAGSIVERGPVAQIFDRPAHPYTRALLRSVPRLGKEELVPIGGQPPTLLNLPAHCAFLPRCPQAGAECWGDKPGLREIGPDHAAACHRLIPWAS
ncbi:MAG: peptide/nickel transport system ATP-binding protein [Moorella sp. (in: firmicutes)]|nr:peptide/nickel transport system ATP-binding protein [Moorella sp. (in: firmicutes)]